MMMMMTMIVRWITQRNYESDDANNDGSRDDDYNTQQTKYNLDVTNIPQRWKHLIGTRYNHNK